MPRAIESVDVGYAPDAVYGSAQACSSFDDGYGSNEKIYPDYTCSCGNGQSFQSPRAPRQPLFDAFGGNNSPEYMNHEGYANARHNMPSTSAARQQRSPHTSCTQSPPPPRLSPSAAYLQASLSPSAKLSDPSTSRKLLILDLNGTLLLRSPRPAIGQQALPRTIYPRPYLSVFVDYLLHPEIVKWLDTMIWSSATPPSVADMVDRCFGNRRAELMAIWTRNDMGLGLQDYNRKSQTTKDLSKPWVEFARSPPLSSSPARPLSPLNHDSPSPWPESPHRHQHSALTTVLIDDSPLKAILQPYNLVCIQEYNPSVRARDLKFLDARMKCERKKEERKKEGIKQQLKDQTRMEEKDLGDLAEEMTELKKDPEIEGELDFTACLSGSQSLSPEPGDGCLVDHVDGRENDIHGNVQQHTTDREREDAQYAPPDFPSREEPALATGLRSEGQFDQTLLAVIGILEALRWESNVAGWIRSGKLWASSSPPVQATGMEAQTTAQLGIDSPLQDKTKVQKPKIEDTSIPEEIEADIHVENAPMWFAQISTVEYWITKGKEALEVLGISVVDGIKN